ncbi:hypothetical protein CC86DRAFT_384291 [Ophiobolus disseminans]|uniref:Uncharacterized protein n=1 Tax=Ophiobolus disseminans TaxID=1469910 RepID=A0A6A6ZSD6_9PLEO|nr:hypothetical protein CC86DRAFT_384291 [Ophiobolus disseminans]
MDVRPPASPTGVRPYNTFLLVTLALCSLAGAWFMRISLAVHDAPVGFLDVVASGAHPNGIAIKKSYTGLKPLDDGLAMLVTAFLPGTAGWNEAFYWQQVHFLSQFTAMVAIMNVEACREKNRGRWIKYTAVWALLYQNIGGAIVVCIWWFLFHRISGQNSYFLSGRTVPVQYARLILPATLVLYLGPTIAMFWPGQSISQIQNFVALWQFAPIFVNIPLWLAAPYVSSAPASGAAKTADLPHLKVLYYVLFFVSMVSQGVVVFNVVASEEPGVELWRVFVPSSAHWLTSMDMGLLYIFQWDWIIIAIMHVLPGIIAVFDIQRFVPDIDTDNDRLLKGVYIVVALVALGGPGASLAAIWGFREEQLAVIEERAEKAEVKKGN